MLLLEAVCQRRERGNDAVIARQGHRSLSKFVSTPPSTLNYHTFQDSKYRSHFDVSFAVGALAKHCRPADIVSSLPSPQAYFFLGLAFLKSRVMSSHAADGAMRS